MTLILPLELLHEVEKEYLLKEALAHTKEVFDGKTIGKNPKKV